MNRKILYKVKTGSHLYGTMTPTSDTDYSSVFLPTAEDILSLQKCDYIDDSTKNSSDNRRNNEEDIDDHKYSIGRYLHLLLQGNPSITEMLFAREPEEIDERFYFLKNNYSRFISLRVYDSFTGFAISQKKKLEYKSKRFHELEEALHYLESYHFDKVENKIPMDEQLAECLNHILKNYKGDKHNVERFHKGLPTALIYEKIKSEYETYGWRVKTDTFELLGYDVKFGSHAIRLLHEGQEILRTGKLDFPITGKAYEDIMKIRRGEVDLEEFYSIFATYESANRKAKEESILPEKADWKLANSWLVDLLKESIKKGEI